MYPPPPPPAGIAQDPSARRKFTTPPPEAGTSPCNALVNKFKNAVATAAVCPDTDTPSDFNSVAAPGPPPAGTAQDPSARRKFTTPPPEAGASPCKALVKAFRNAVATAAVWAVIAAPVDLSNVAAPGMIAASAAATALATASASTCVIAAAVSIVPLTNDVDGQFTSGPSETPVSTAPALLDTLKIIKTFFVTESSSVTQNVPPAGNPAALDTVIDPDPATYGTANVVFRRFANCSAIWLPELYHILAHLN